MIPKNEPPVAIAVVLKRASDRGEAEADCVRQDHGAKMRREVPAISAPDHVRTLLNTRARDPDARAITAEA
jgi:hypothetical protein